MVTALRKAGFEIEKRRFLPHVTLARLNGASSAHVASFLEGLGSLRSEPFTVAAFHVYSSRLRSEGADYHREATYRLSP